LSYWRLFYHVVWSTKGREPLIGDATERAIRQSVRSTTGAMECAHHAIGFMPDHVHVAVSIPPSIAISEVVGRIKGASAHAVNHTHPAANFRWQSEYGVLSFGEKALPDVIDYIENQKNRHQSGPIWQQMERTEDAVQSASADL